MSEPRLTIEMIEDKSGEFEASLAQRCKDYPYNTHYCCSYHEGMQDGIEIGLRSYRGPLIASQTALRHLIDEVRSYTHDYVIEEAEAALLPQGEGDAKG